MYRILVVDDEPIHRREMANLIRSLRKGYEVDEAENGKEALELLNRNNNYNILITDIKMPVMDGLQLLEAVWGRNEKIKVVILSGYDYFDYAIGAMKLGACDYILKPIDPDTVESMLTRVEKLIEKQQETDRSKEHLQKELDTIYPVYLDYIMNKWIKGKLCSEETSIIRDILDNRGSCRTLAILIKDRGNCITKSADDSANLDEIKNYIRCTVHDRLKKFGRGTSFFVEDKDLIFVVLLTFPQTGFNYYSNTNDLEAELNRLASIFLEQKKLMIRVGISDLYQCSYENYKTTIDEAFKALDAGFYRIGPVNFHSSDSYLPMKYSLVKVPEYENELKDAVFHRDKNRIIRWFDTSYLKITWEEKVFPDILISYMENLLQSCLDEVKNFIEKGDYDKLSLKIRQSINTCINFAEMLDTAKKLIFEITDTFENALEDRNRYIVQKCKEYISAHISDELSVEMLANKFHFNPNYFSTVFKKVTGIALSNYILEQRLQMAAQLLGNSEKKIYEIAKKTGFNDEKYFCKAFKNKFGVTPNHYRKITHRGL